MFRGKVRLLWEVCWVLLLFPPFSLSICSPSLISLHIWKKKCFQPWWSHHRFSIKPFTNLFSYTFPSFVSSYLLSTQEVLLTVHLKCGSAVLSADTAAAFRDAPNMSAPRLNEHPPVINLQGYQTRSYLAQNTAQDQTITKDKCPACRNGTFSTAPKRIQTNKMCKNLCKCRRPTFVLSVAVQDVFEWIR